MGIYLRDMEMPKNCDECNISDIRLCKLWMRMTISQRVEGKHPNCPLVEVPTPHGRLIDADALKEEGADIHMDYVCDGYVEDTTWGYSDDLLDSQPTIIEAEE